MSRPPSSCAALVEFRIICYHLAHHLLASLIRMMMMMMKVLLASLSTSGKKNDAISTSQKTSRARPPVQNTGTKSQARPPDNSRQ